MLDEDTRARRVETAIARTLEGDTEAFGELYAGCAQTIYEYVRRMVRDDHEAEDITQQAFLRAMLRLETYRPARGPFDAWMRGVARNAAVDHLRRCKPVLAPEVLPTDVESDDRPAVLADALGEALAQLPVRQRQVVLLLHAGVTCAELAGAMGQSPGAIHALHNRARTRLRTTLRARGAAPSITSLPTARQPALARHVCEA